MALRHATIWRSYCTVNSYTEEGVDMPKLSIQNFACVSARNTAVKRGVLLGVALAAALPLALLVGGCAVEVQNTQPAQALKQQAQPPGSVYAGWRVYQDKCAACHGPAATGTAGAPDLLPKVRDMGPRQFVSLVLQRYDWSAQLGVGKATRPPADAVVDALVQRKDYMLTMPAWQSEPSVKAHIVDIYAYLSARAMGSQGPERPER